MNIKKPTEELDCLIRRYSSLNVCKQTIWDAFNVFRSSFQTGGKIMVAGNGGSCSDSNHIVGELMKSFCVKRRVDSTFADKLAAIDKTRGLILARSLEKALPAISLMNHSSLNSAFSNDIENGGVLSVAQQVYGYGSPNDSLWLISTSGNAENLVYAAVTAKALRIHTVGLVGKDGGKLANICDVAIVAPENETFRIQELHLPIYHCICLMLESEFFGSNHENEGN